MYKKIVVALDGSEVAEQVLPYVGFLATGLKAPVELVRAYGLPDTDWSDTVGDEYTFVAPKEISESEGRMRGKIYLDQILARQRETAQDYLDKTAKNLIQAGAQVTTKAVEEPAAEAILAAAEQDPLILIVMSTHGRSGVARWAMGSVADKVLHAAASPLLLVHVLKDQEVARRATVRNIVLPLDGSPVAAQALSTAAAVARSLNAKVHAVWAIPPIAGYYGDYMGYDATSYVSLYQETEDAAKVYLRQIADRLTAAGVADVEPKVLLEDPGSAIVDTARALVDSLIIMTTHGRSGLGRWVLGSVADKVVRYAGRPVLLIRAQAENPEE